MPVRSLALIRTQKTLLLLILLLFGSSAVLAQQNVSVNVSPVDPDRSCRSLKSVQVPASALGRPTNGAYVTSAKLVHDSRGEYCKVLGRIRPVDPSAHDIRFEVNLPTNWNHKAVHFGGGTFDGWLGGPAGGRKRGPMSIATQPGALARGFATFGGDSGHHRRYFPLPDALNVLSASFVRNDEERTNFLHDALKKTHDAAVAIMESRYGSRPSRMFFLGGSTGGREAYSVVQRWPEDYDGVLGAYAAWSNTELELQYIRVSRAVYTKGGFLPRSKTRLLARSAMKQCDALDGLSDGIIANVAACHFDPATLRCSMQGEHKNCLTPQQLKTVEAFASEQKTAKPLWNGVQSIAGFNVLAGTDLTGQMGILHHAQHRPMYFLNSIYYVIGDRILRGFLTGERFNSLDFDTTTGGRFADDLIPRSRECDASDPDLTRFAQHGGKFLILHGTADATIPTGASEMYYKMVQSTMSQAEVDRFLRFYLVPGFGHAHGVFNAGFDALGLLDHWLDTDTAPENIVVVDNNKRTRGRTRPLCAYPAWPKYKGSGDVNAASSFTCVIE